MNTIAKQPLILIGIKLLHTVVWIFIAACVLGIPIASALSRFRVAAALSAVVLVECLILAANRCRCPMTDMAAAHTGDRADNFDIYLPLWLARYNKLIFGSLFVTAELFLLFKWVISL